MAGRIIVCASVNGVLRTSLLWQVVGLVVIESRDR